MGLGFVHYWDSRETNYSRLHKNLYLRWVHIGMEVMLLGGSRAETQEKVCCVKKVVWWVVFWWWLWCGEWTRDTTHETTLSVCAVCSGGEERRDAGDGETGDRGDGRRESYKYFQLAFYSILLLVR
jgi:hypothetical protein